jgi:Ca-activated chloride channel family protein
MRFSVCRKTERESAMPKNKSWERLMLIVFFLITALDPSSAFCSLQEKKEKEIRHDISVSAISIAVTVQDKKGRFVKDLSKEDFRIYENGANKDINYFSHNFEAPVSLTVLLDVSGSMALQDKFKDSKDALRYLVKYLITPKDELSLLIFADGAVEVAVKFSREKDGFLTILDRTEAYGQTALNDAVAVSPEFANRGTNEKRALLLLTDGIENDSEYSPDQAVEVARKVDIPIYTIGYRIPLSAQMLKKYKRTSDTTSDSIVQSLEKFSKSTGGKAFFLDKPTEIVLAFRQIMEELRHQYILGYTSYKDPKSEYRKILVTTPNKDFRVRTREGYYSGEKKDSPDIEK